jgi:hypothetical protein
MDCIRVPIGVDCASILRALRGVAAPRGEGGGGVDVTCRTCSYDSIVSVETLCERSATSLHSWKLPEDR